MLFSGFIGGVMMSILIGPSTKSIDVAWVLGIIMLEFIILAFLIPFQMSNYFCSNFETGSIKNIIASGHSRSSFVIVKFIKEAIHILKFFICCFLGGTLVAIITMIARRDFNILNNSLFLFLSLYIYRFMLIYTMLIYFSAITLFICMLFRKAYVGTLTTVIILALDIVSATLLPDTNINKFFKVNLYINKLLLSYSVNDIKSLIMALIMPVVIIFFFLSLSILVFQKQDIKI